MSNYPYMRSMNVLEAISTVPLRLKDAGLRPTRQRMALAALLFDSPHRHVTAEQLQCEAQAKSIKVSLATIYNTLHQFTDAGLLREVVIEPGRSYFDTNIDDHHHFFVENSGQLQDIPVSGLALACLPAAPEGMRITRVEIIVRLEPVRP